MKLLMVVQQGKKLLPAISHMMMHSILLQVYLLMVRHKMSLHS